MQTRYMDMPDADQVEIDDYALAHPGMVVRSGSRITYRAAWWSAQDGQSSIQLTAEDDCGLSDEDLIDLAKATAREIADPAAHEGGTFGIATVTEDIAD